MSKRHHLSRNQSASKITMSKVLWLTRNLHFEAKSLRSLAPVTKSRLWTTKTRCPLHLRRKVTTMCENEHGTTTKAQSLGAPAAGPQILRARAVEMHVDDFEKRECTANSSELAGHGRTSQRSNSCLSITVRTAKCVHTFWGKHICNFLCDFKVQGSIVSYSQSSLISDFSRCHISFSQVSAHFFKLKLAVRQYVEEFAAVSPTSDPLTGSLPVDEAYNGELCGNAHGCSPGI